MATKLYILQTSHKLNSDPGTMWDVFRYYNEEYEPGRKYTGHIGRIYKQKGGSFSNNKDSRIFSTKESAANHLLKLDNTYSRKVQREHGTWDVKTHPLRTLKSTKTARLRSYDESGKTKGGHDIRYKLERK